MRVAIRLRQLHRDAERAAARDDRHLVQRIGVRAAAPRRPRARLRDTRVVTRSSSVITSDLRSTPISTLSRASIEVAVVDVGAAGARREQRRFVDQVREVGAREPGRAARDRRRSTSGVHRDLRGVHAQDRLAAPAGRGCPRSPGGRTGPGAAAPCRGCPAGWWRRRRRCPGSAAKPSISTSSWFSVCSRSSWLSDWLPRLRPTASSSSMKMMQAPCLRASLNSLRTRAAPTPAYISTKSEPLANRNGTPASPAIERASSVLPVPGGPTSSMPFGMRPPSAAKRAGLPQEVDDLPDLGLRLVHARHVRERDLLRAASAGGSPLPSTAGGRRRGGKSNDADNRQQGRPSDEAPKLEADPEAAADGHVDAAARLGRAGTWVRGDVASGAVAGCAAALQQAAVSDDEPICTSAMVRRRQCARIRSSVTSCGAAFDPAHGDGGARQRRTNRPGLNIRTAARRFGG